MERQTFYFSRQIESTGCCTFSFQTFLMGWKILVNSIVTFFFFYDLAGMVDARYIENKNSPRE
jgi:hypothetical protein